MALRDSTNSLKMHANCPYCREGSFLLLSWERVCGLYQILKKVYDLQTKNSNVGEHLSHPLTYTEEN